MAKKVEPAGADLGPCIRDLVQILRFIVNATKRISPGAVSDDLELAVERRLRAVEAAMGAVN
jgi:hypothetical protein